MIIFPAIDIKDGSCVRLKKGAFDTVEKVAEDPFATAEAFRRAGAEHLHMVDLDGAKDAALANRDLFVEMARSTTLKIELGGGIRSLDAVEYYLSRGIHRVILGSAAVKDPALVRDAVREYGDRIMVGIDAKDGIAATEGWLSSSGVDYLTLGRAMEQAGVRHLIFTDISRDGMLTGPNLEQLDALNRAVGCTVTASGGISGIEDIRALKRLGLWGAICGKSLYQGTLDLAEAVREAGD